MSATDERSLGSSASQAGSSQQAIEVRVADAAAPVLLGLAADGMAQIVADADGDPALRTGPDWILQPLAVVLLGTDLEPQDLLQAALRDDEIWLFDSSM
ncbi:MAG: hypothetical protein R2748_34320 [Bryobacterales bacterium]